MSRKSKKARKIKKALRAIVMSVAVIMLITSVLLFMKAWEDNRGVYDEEEVGDSTVTVYDGKEYVLKEDIETFLVLGLDKLDGFSATESYNNDMQADFLMLFVFDNQAKKCTGIHISRDTMTDVSVLGVAGNRIDTVRQQIALSHTYGNGRDVSCRNTADSVSDLLNGMKVNHYISLTMDAVGIINDSIGGVKVRILDDLTAVDSRFEKGKTVTLKGDEALTYIRARYGLEDSSNVSRMKRQRQYVEALYGRFTELHEKDKAISVEALNEISEYMVSDRSVTQLQELADKFISYEFGGIKVIGGDNLKGEKYMEFYADERSVNETVIGLFYDEKVL